MEEKKEEDEGGSAEVGLALTSQNGNVSTAVWVMRTDAVAPGGSGMHWL
jgi:hypothetical protein